MPIVQVYFTILAIAMFIFGAVFTTAIIANVNQGKFLPSCLQGRKSHWPKKLGFWFLVELTACGLYSSLGLYWTLEKIQALDRSSGENVILVVGMLVLCGMVAQAIGWISANYIIEYASGRRTSRRMMVR